MNNLKRDLLEELVRDKGYLEMDLAGLAQNPTVRYRKKVNKMKNILNKIAIVNGTFGLIDVYFPEPKVEQEVVQAPVAQAPEETVQAPVVEQEIVNEPVVEEPVVEEPVAEVVKAPVKKVKASTSPFPKIN